MKKTLIFALVVVAGSAQAATLFYGGDYDGRDGFEDGTSGSVAFDDFTLTSQQTITGLFGNFADFGAQGNGVFSALGNFDIRTGVSNHNQGTSVATGTAVLTHAASAGTLQGAPMTLYSSTSLAVTTGTLTLGPGTFFLGFSISRAVAGGNGQVFIGSTSGANPVGLPIHNNNSYLNGNGFNMEAISGGNLEGGGIWDLSQGVTGNAVPEPATMAALGIGLVALARRRRK